MFSSIEKPTQSIRRVSGPIYQVTETAEYRINTQKSAIFPYTRNEPSEKEL